MPSPTASKPVGGSERDAVAGVAWSMPTLFDVNDYVHVAIRVEPAGLLKVRTTPRQCSTRSIVARERRILAAASRRIIEGLVASPIQQGLADRLEHPRRLASVKNWPWSNEGCRTMRSASGSTSAPPRPDHVSHVMTKLYARDRAQLVVVAYESGLVRRGSSARRIRRPTTDQDRICHLPIRLRRSPDPLEGANPMAAIELHGPTKRFGAVTAVDDLTLELAAGTVTGFLGPNGAGKTTTLRMLLGLVAPTAGSATFAGRRYVDLDEPARQVGAVLEASSFHPGRRAVDHLRILASAADLPAQRVHDVLDQVGMTDTPAAAWVGSRSGCASGSASPPPSSASRPCSSSTSRPTVSIRRACTGCGRSCAASRRRAHRRRLEPPAGRGRPDRRRRRDPRQGPAGHERPAGRAAPFVPQRRRRAHP